MPLILCHNQTILNIRRIQTHKQIPLKIILIKINELKIILIKKVKLIKKNVKRSFVINFILLLSIF